MGEEAKKKHQKAKTGEKGPPVPSYRRRLARYHREVRRCLKAARHLRARGREGRARRVEAALARAREQHAKGGRA